MLLKKMREINRKDNYIKNREKFIITKCRNKSVLHLGCTDWPFTEIRFNNRTLLFSQIDNVAKKQIGIDNDKKSIEYLKKKGYKNILFYNLNKPSRINFKPDIIIFGETLEHLMNLEIALTNMKKLMNKDTEIIITVPNSTSFGNFWGNFMGIIREHPDHKVSFNYCTLKQLLEFNKFQIKKILVTDEIQLSKGSLVDKKKAKQIKVRILSLVINYLFIFPAKRILVFLFPLFCEGLIFVVKK